MVENASAVPVVPDGDGVVIRGCRIDVSPRNFITMLLCAEARSDRRQHVELHTRGFRLRWSEQPHCSRMQPF